MAINNCEKYLVLLSVNLAILLGHVAGSKVLQIRGISIAKSAFYSSDRDFQCLDGSLFIPFSQVNDNYCDCADGSDEPGTPACTNGSFYCENSGHKSRYIPSTWVNDGVCDCCDASDEYNSVKECSNNCQELGKEARLEQQKAEELIREGNKIRVELIAKAKQLKTDNQARLSKLHADFKEALVMEREKELVKTQAEERENAALEKIKATKPEKPEAKEAEEAEEEAGETGETGEEEEESQDVNAKTYFKFLDTDNSGTVTIAELQKARSVNEKQALYFFHNNTEVNFQEFLDIAWKNIEPFLIYEEDYKAADHKEENEEIQELVGEEAEHLKEEEESTEGIEGTGGTEGEDALGDEEKVEEPQVIHDEETQALIDEAAVARNNLQAAEKATNELRTEIRKLEEKLDRDYGSDDEFATLDSECFEYTDLEYVYTLCMFSKATQRSKSGGSDISLGQWNDWIGPEGHKYLKMKYDRGLNCWNGPTRTTTVNLICGKENRLVSVTEPNRCEYAMEFTTPAMCNPSLESVNAHDEL